MHFQRRILIVEDDVFMGSLMVEALANHGFETALAESAVKAKRKVSTFDPDAVLVDINLGDGPNGVDFVRMIMKTRPEIAPILLSKHADSESAGLAGADIPPGVAYLRKSLMHDTDALVKAINSALNDSSPALRQDKESKDALDLLTKAQREILHLMALGLSNKEIAKQRGVSVSSIEQRSTEIYKAFGILQDDTVMPRVQAIRRYIAVAGMPER
jgi:DNA-binding NarL/FixJ family response regulator